MVKIKKKTIAILFSLSFAVTLFLAAFAVPVWAEENGDSPDKPDKKTILLEKMKEIKSDDDDPYERKGEHGKKETFEKNFCLSPEQKEYSIKQCEKIVSQVLDPEMSDLEKYYRLAVWENMHVIYDSEFWSGDYNFDCYRHQWDAYGVLTD